MSAQDRREQAAMATSLGPGTHAYPLDHSRRLAPVWRVCRAGVTIVNLVARIRRLAWVAAYELEEARQAHAAHRRYLRSAGCCAALCVLTFFGGRT